MAQTRNPVLSACLATRSIKLQALDPNPPWHASKDNSHLPKQVVSICWVKLCRLVKIKSPFCGVTSRVCSVSCSASSDWLEISISMIGDASVENSRNQTPQILEHTWVGNKFHNENGTSCNSLGEATSVVEAPTRTQVCPACLAAHTKIMQTLSQSLLIIIKNIQSWL